MGKYNYGIVLDAGSSGTRLHVYRWPKPSQARKGASIEDLQRLPEVQTKKKWTTKKKPGLSSFSEDPNGVEPYLDELFEHTTDIIPKDEISNTPVFLLATAGMRLLPDRERNAILEAVCRHTRSTTRFQIPDCDLHVQVIPGSTEGLYGWIAANYLLDGFDKLPSKGNTKSHDTYGFLDMGGASAQIAFAPNTTEAEKHADDLKLLRLRTLGGASTEYGVFTTTWLGFGVNEARRRYLEELYASVGLDHATNEILDPCLPVGLRVDAPQSSSALNDIELVGTGKFAECVDRTTPLLHKDAPCPDLPCLFDGRHAPAIDFSVNHFVGVSEYWHTTHEIFEMGHTDKAYDFETYQRRVADFCQQDWATISGGLEESKWGNKVDNTTAAEVCFKASWLINVLHNGIGVPRTALDPSEDDSGHNTTKQILDKAKEHDYLAPFQAVNKIDSTEVSWTLGKMVLYASSQVPPADESVQAVGFGSNDPSHGENTLPEDFQYAGGVPDGTLTSIPDLDSVVPSTSNPLLNSPSFHRRTPGFLLIGAIIVVVAVLLCGRDRRNALFHRLMSCCGRRDGRYSSSPSNGFSTLHKQGRNTSGASGGWTNKLPFGLGSHSGARYERVPIDTGSQDVELGNVPYSDSGSGPALNGDDSGSGSSVGTSRARSRNGPTTPRLNDLNPGTSSNKPFAQGVGLGLNGLSTDRGNGLIGSGYFGQSIASESTGHRSRTGSPTRWRSPGLTPKYL